MTIVDIIKDSTSLNIQYDLQIPTYVDIYPEDLNSIHYLTNQVSKFSLPDPENLYTINSNLPINVEIGVNRTSYSVINNYYFYNYIGKLKIIDIACGGYHTLFLENTGKVLGCGDNSYNQLAITDNTKSYYTPTYIPALENIECRSIACGENHSFFQSIEGSIYGIGRNDYGQLGIGNNISPQISLEELQTVTGTPITKTITQISCGGNHSVFFDTSNMEVYTTGQNNYGQLGINNYVNQNIPNKINTGTSTIASIICGYNTTGLIYFASGQNGVNSTIFGINSNEQLGKVLDVTNKIPEYNTEIVAIKDLILNEHYSIVLSDTGGFIYAGGHEDGDITSTNTVGTYKYYITSTITKTAQTANLWQEGSNIISEEDKSADKNIKKIICGRTHIIYLTRDNKIYSYGLNDKGQLNNIINVNTSNYYNNTGINNSNIINIYSGASSYHSIIVYEENGECKIAGWGDNSKGQIGISSNIETVINSNLSYNVDYNIKNFNGYERYKYLSSNNIKKYNSNVNISTNEENNVYINTNGNVIIRGNNKDVNKKCGIKDILDRSLIKIGTTYQAIENIIKVVTGKEHVLMLNNVNVAYSVGTNSYGQLGRGTYNHGYVVEMIVNNSTIFTNANIVEIACGGYHSMLIDSSSNVYVCGKNDKGQLGINNKIEQNRMTNISLPLDIGNDSIKKISGGLNHTILMTTKNGTIYGCGDNSYGQLGIGSTISESTSLIKITSNLKKYVEINGSNGINEIGCGKNHTLVINKEGKLYGFGDNREGQLRMIGKERVYNAIEIENNRIISGIYVNNNLDKSYIRSS